MRKNSYLLRVVFAFTLMMFGLNANAAFDENKGKQSYECVGMGNSNEWVAYADVVGDGSAPVVTYKLGDAAGFITGVHIYAIPYKEDKVDDVAYSDLMPYDYRFPTKGNNGIELGSTNDLSLTEIQATSSLVSGQKYRVYLTVDVVSNKTLPFLAKEKTYLGGQILKVGGNAISTDYADVTTRLIVPKRQLLYVPGTDVDGNRRDGYSKFYRIPAMTLAKDGTIVATSDARKSHAHDVKNDIDILCRRSSDNGASWGTPIMIAGNTGYASKPDDANGYGDAALATLPNGNILCTMVNGDCLRTDYSGWLWSDGSSTKTYYRISTDNGVTWGDLKQISSDLLNKNRGNIAAGSMCVVKEGALAGKVLALFRFVKYTWGVKNYSGNYLMIYDPESDSWSKFNNEIKTDNKDNDDEAHLIEIAPNKFLMSARSLKANWRNYDLITISEDGSSMSYSKVNASNEDLGVGCNGDIMSYTAKGDKKYMLQALPISSVSDINGYSKTARSGLTFYTTDLYSGSGDINWNKSFCFSDPSGKLAENAQYSSIITQADNTIGVLYEEYPTVVYHHDHTSVPEGDFYLATWYMNLRIEDLIDGAETPEQTALTAPVITPRSGVYNINVATDRPTIEINQNNDKENVKTYYIVEQVRNNEVIRRYEANYEAPFTLEADGIGLNLESGDVVNVSSRCLCPGYEDSAISNVSYKFISDVRKLKVVTAVAPGDNKTVFTVEGLGEYNESDGYVNVEVGKKVVVVATPNADYRFSKFSSDEAGENNLNFSYKVDTDGKNQISFTVPDAMGGDAEMVIYSQFTTPYGGMVSEVSINNTDIYGESYTKLWSSDSNVSSMPTAVNSSVRYNAPTAKDNTTDGLHYSNAYMTTGIVATQKIAPDALAANNYNAVTLFKIDDEYVKNESGNYVYGLFNSYNNPYSEDNAVYTNAYEVIDWFAAKSRSIIVNPTIATFEYPIVAQGVDMGGYKNIDIESYVVDNNTATIDEIIGGNYLYKNDYTVTYDLATAISNVSVANNLRVAVNGNSVTFVVANPMSVKVVDMMGRVVKVLNVDNSATISLVSGMYIANGQKFVVK